MLHIAAGILLLIGGIAFPMGLLFWLNNRLGRQPGLGSLRVGLLLALNGVLPVGLILGGLALLSPRFGATPAVQTAIGAALAATVVIGLALGWLASARGRSER